MKKWTLFSFWGLLVLTALLVSQVAVSQVAVAQFSDLKPTGKSAREPAKTTPRQPAKVEPWKKTTTNKPAKKSVKKADTWRTAPAPKRIARAVYFPADKFPFAQFVYLALAAALDGKSDPQQDPSFGDVDSEVVLQSAMYAQLMPLIRQLSNDVSISTIYQGKDIDSPEGAWILLYGKKESVTEIAKTLEIIARGTPEKKENAE
ncbi:MAG TPA: hypothetical protein DEB39_04645 [Planctomycetaceae bacterium]|nr:hypothetical protein [Planctomycetaceae bacterium]